MVRWNGNNHDSIQVKSLRSSEQKQIKFPLILLNQLTWFEKTSKKIRNNFWARRIIFLKEDTLLTFIQFMHVDKQLPLFEIVDKPDFISTDMKIIFLNLGIIITYMEYEFWRNYENKSSHLEPIWW